PGGTPVGAKTAFGRFDLLVDVVVTQGVLLATPVDVSPPPPGNVRDAILAATSQGLRVDVRSMLAGLSIDASAGDSLVLTDDLVIARFGNLTTPVAPLAHSFQW